MYADLSNRSVVPFICYKYLTSELIRMGCASQSMASQKGNSVMCEAILSTGGGGSSIVKVPGDVPPARVYFFGSLAKGVLFGNFSRVRSRQGYAFWEFWSKRCQNSVIFVKKTQLLKNFGLENAKIWQVLPRKCQFRALLKEKLV